MIGVALLTVASGLCMIVAQRMAHNRDLGHFRPFLRTPANILFGAQSGHSPSNSKTMPLATFGHSSNAMIATATSAADIVRTEETTQICP